MRVADSTSTEHEQRSKCQHPDWLTISGLYFIILQADATVVSHCLLQGDIESLEASE